MAQRVQSGHLLDSERLREFCSVPLQKVGMSPEDALIAAEVLVRTDLRGVHTHGVRFLPNYIKRIQAGGINSRAEFKVIHQTASTALVDGNAGLGHVASYKAVQLGIEKANHHDVAVVLVRNSNHFGAAGHYALMCAEAGFIGIVLTNTPRIMKVSGSKSRVLGNGPTAYGVPSRGAPIVFDVAMSVVAGSTILMAAERNESIVEGWIVNSDGLPTTNPNDMAAGGALVPIADHKGYGLTLLGELLAGALSGAGMASGVGKTGPNGLTAPNVPWNVGHSFIVLKPNAFMSLDSFKARVSVLTTEIQSSPKAAGVNRIYVPGEIEAEKELARIKDGIGFDDVTWNSLLLLAKEFGIVDMLEKTRRQ